ncbi:MAG: helix-turn-helix domain-containing protein [Bacteroidetes bacterium]|nr:helix-turn-helix domain-containing protein [Bacteroidota bacterium]
MESFLTILYTLPVYQCMVIAFLLFISRSETGGSSRIIFGVFYVFLSIYFGFNLLYRLKDFSALTYLYYPILPVILCLIPTFYLYILSVTRKNFRFNIRNAIHFLPAAAILILNTPFLFMTFAQKIGYLSFRFDLQRTGSLIPYLTIIYIIAIYLIVNIQLIFYLILTLKQYRKHLLLIENHYSSTEQIDTSWTRSFMISFLIFFIFNNLLYFIGFSQHLIAGVLYTVSMLVITLFAGMRGLKQKAITISGVEDNEDIPPLLSGEEASESDDLTTNIRKDKISAIKYKGSPLTPEQKKQLAEDLESLMKNERIFIQSDLTIDQIAERLKTNSKYISQIINEFYSQNYYHYINSYRIQEAKSLMTDPANDKYSILGISNIAGFASKSTFNTAFRKFTGTTPSEFRNNALSVNSKDRENA